ncbi:ubiquinol oxidase subunit II [Sneathiella marina]|uniref:Ubiquinol oxidase subunit 2 n=1 Tax=Sneathiella marina TaxID=2950108 RepID=A0ABY4W736_9PROT|nr:ubiquinol oxidase subunit II [Sneathiella marina]USG61943.1 ubiquinol oxidase subunit II [Sneathiella marina]
MGEYLLGGFKNGKSRISALFLVLLAASLTGCGLMDAPVLDPKGPIATAERDLLFAAFCLMLIVLIPVFAMTLFFSWRYRENGGKGKHRPKWASSSIIETFVWLVPIVIIISLSYLTWTYTFKLDPYRALESDKPAINVQVIAQDWKWLFIYPDYNIASVNELAFPSNRPLSLEITSDTVMNSFMVPALGGQIYAMAGMTTRLQLLADENGSFTGRNTQFSGDGFSDQHFQAVAMTEQEFENWVAARTQSPEILDGTRYRKLAAKSVAHPVEYFSDVVPDLFKGIIAKYTSRDCPGDSESIQLICQEGR